MSEKTFNLIFDGISNKVIDNAVILDTLVTY